MKVDSGRMGEKVVWKFWIWGG